MQKYDAIVVGAGLGGLSSACRLAKAGKKVLLIEQHNLPGGVASSFKRGRFEFETALHELAAIGAPEKRGDIYKLVNEDYGVPINWLPIPDLFRSIHVKDDGTIIRDFTMPKGRKEFADKLEEYAPGNRKAMEQFYELFDECERALAYISSAHGGPDSKVLRSEYPNFLKAGAYTPNDVLTALKFTPEAKKIMGTYWSYMAVDMYRLSSIFYLMMVGSLIDGGAYIPEHTSHQMTAGLLERFHQFGGESWFNVRANQILFEGDRACGVSTTAGDVYAKHVIWNGNPSMAMANMIPAEVIPERELKLANARKFSARMFVVYIGLNKSCEELGIKDYNIFISPGLDTADEYKRVGRMEKIRSTAALCYNVVNPDIGPKGTCQMSFTMAYSKDVWGDVEIEDYVKFKNEKAREILELYERATGCSIIPYIEEISVATPWTFCRYASCPEGGVYGYEAAEWDNCMARMMSLSYDNNFKGLKFTGASGPRGDGYSEALITGDMMGKMVLGELAKEDM